jgi:RNA polymerase sigma-70 factor (ECF subfamily)
MINQVTASAGNEIEPSRPTTVDEVTPELDVRERPPDAVAPSPSDADIIESVLQGDTASFELLMRRYNQRLFRVARSVVRNDNEAEEIVQEAYVRGYERLSQLENRNRFSAWISQIVFHESLASRRRNRRMVAMDLSDTHNPAQARLTVHHNVGEDAEARELGPVLTKAVDDLPDDLRTVFTLRLIEDLDTEETAACLDLTTANVKIRLHRARALLQERIDRQIGAQVRQLYQFGGERCNRIVAAVLVRIQNVDRRGDAKAES